jgi:hypothetical protein
MIARGSRGLGLRRAFGVLTRAVMLLVGLTATSQPAGADATDPTPGRWSGGAGVGFWVNTPDGVEFGLEGHADYFWTRHVSVGPLAQYAGAGNDRIFGLSVQAKRWWVVPNTRRPARVAVQGGIGFVRADIEDADTGAADVSGSFLVPVGIALDYAVTRNVAVTVALLLNLTSLGERVRVGGREVDLRTDAMPALYLGVRF